MVNKKPEVLILGGTTEARHLAKQLHESFGSLYHIVTSFAGITKAPKSDAGSIRTGGFGGVQGLSTYIQENNVTYLVNGTHPFATRMSSNAVEATKGTNCFHLRLMRPAWEETENDHWITCPTLEKAAEWLTQKTPIRANVFLSVGSQDLRYFQPDTERFFFARMIELPPENAKPKNCSIIQSRPPFTILLEETLFSRLNIDIVVMKNSGAVATEAKIHACRNLNIPVLMINRPEAGIQPMATTAENAFEIIKENLKL